MKKYLELFRIKHYIKNFLIFLPLFFSGNAFNFRNFIICVIAFVVFSLMSSLIYIFNDIIDVEKDRKHPVKKNRPLASGTITIKKAKILFCLLLVTIFSVQFLLYIFKLYTVISFAFTSLYLFIYFIMNILYSIKLKKIPIIDIMILSFGFLLRVLYGGSIINVNVSSWLYLTVLSVSLYMALAKRRGEMKKNGPISRDVLKYYTYDFLDKFIYVFLTAAIVFYSLWCTIGLSNVSNETFFIYSIIPVIFIIMKYNLNIENNSYGDPIDIIYNDKLLIFSVLVYVVYMGVLIYV